MNINNLIQFISRKSGINKILFEFCRGNFVSSDESAATLALNRLVSFSPKPNGSSVFSENSRVITHEFDIHIVVPCYNSQKYLKKCLDSLKLRHSYLVSVVNDGSTDGSLSIIESYSKDKNFEVKNKANGGSSSARNAGMLPAIRGKYIAFVDSDDYIDPNALDEMLDFAMSNDCDVVQGDAFSITESGIKKRRKRYKYGNISKVDLDGVPWGKVIKSELFANVQFPEGFFFEDSVMALVVYHLASKIYGYNIPMYYYRYVPGSASRQAKNPKNLDTLYVVLRLYEDILKLGLSIDEYEYSRFINQSSFLYSRLIGLGMPIVCDAFIVYSNFIKNMHQKYHFELSSYRLQKLENALLNSNFKKFIAASKYL